MCKVTGFIESAALLSNLSLITTELKLFYKILYRRIPCIYTASFCQDAFLCFLLLPILFLVN